ncbi:exosortase A [Qipengyuania sp. CAU 1752]
MPHEAALDPVGDKAWWASIAPIWRGPLARLALLWGSILLVTHRDWLAMFDQWWNISTYNHILLVPAILAGLVWIRRGELAKITPVAWWPGLVAFVTALLLWFLGRIGEINTFSQLGAVAAMQAAVLAVLGPRVTLGLIFPLGYALFLVPFGDELVPALQMITAKITIALTEWSGVPAHIEGVFIDTPVGLFEVAEACSGVQFLVAMVALGVMVAQACFTSWVRRALFLGLCLVVPIIANGIRAWGTIYIAQSQGIEFAAGFDHIFYGWIFFAIVLAIVLGAAWPYFDRAPNDPGIDADALLATRWVDRIGRVGGSAATVTTTGTVLLLGFAMWAGIATRLEAEPVARLSLPQVPDWQAIAAEPDLAWQPRARGADQRLLGRYRNDAGQTVDVFLARYTSPGGDSDPGAPGEGALVPDTPWRWMGGGVAANGAQVDHLFALGRIRRVAMTWYRHGDLLTGSPADLKFAVIADRFTMQARPTTMLIVSAVEAPGSDATAAIAAFAGSTEPLGPWIDRIAERR